nr:YdeI/OmpD-associated family protein [Deinococcus aestuarii]
MEVDTEPREVEVPDALRGALNANPTALERFGQLSSRQHRQPVLTVEGTRNPETCQ